MATRGRTLPAGVGTIRFHDETPHFDEFGLAVRIGLANPTPETATWLYPLFELAPGESRPAPGECLAGRPVFCWAGGAWAARLMGVPERTLRDWVPRGAPARRSGRRYEYAIPHLGMWSIEYKHQNRSSGAVTRVDLAVAVARWDLRRAEEDAAR